MNRLILADVKFPDVLVAKAYSHDGKGLDMLLYHGKEAGVFRLALERLMPGNGYRIGHEQIVDDQTGCGKSNVAIKGRTSVMLTSA